MSQMLHDIRCTEDETLHDVKMFELEANEPGLGVSFKCNGCQTTYYILDDPGKPE